MAIAVSGTNPTNVTVVSNTVTTNTTFNAGAPNDRIYQIDDDIAGTINDGILVSGFGLQLETEVGFGIAMVNNGGVTIDQSTPALELLGNGGAVTYGGAGVITNDGVGRGLAIENNGAGSVSATINGNITTLWSQPVYINTVSGAVNFTQAAGTTISNGPGTGSDALQIGTVEGNIVANLNGTIVANLYGLEANSDTGDITANFTGSISAGENGIGVLTAGSITINSSGNVSAADNALALSGTGAGLATANVTAGQIHADGIGIFANATGTGGVLINMTGGQIGTAAERAGAGIFSNVSGAAGDLTVAATTIFSDLTALDAEITNAAATGNILVTANGAIDSTNGFGIVVANAGTGSTTVVVNNSVTGTTGVVNGSSNATVINNSSITGTGGTAVNLGAGNDVYNGVSGLLTGTVLGGAGDDTLRGGAGNDTLNGGADNDFLDGGIGADTMIGGTGNDIFVVDNAGDIVVEGSGEGTDEIRTTLASYSIAALTRVENLTGTSSSGQTLTGNTAANVITGGTGNDTLDGGAGNDQLFGGAGNDTAVYSGNRADYLITALGNGAFEVSDQRTGSPDGTDTLDGVESLAFADGTFVSGTTGDDTIDGGAGNDALDGGGGDDILNGRGGIDTMAGGTGNDTFYVDDAGDMVLEVAGQGNDRVLAFVDYTLTAGSEVETLDAAISSATTALNLTGNELANTIIGNAGDNLLDGGGGADMMFGNGGNDTYFVDDAGDQVFESAGDGTDRVLTSVDYTLTAGSHVETLDAAVSSAVTPLNLTGNERANTVIGNAGDNTINGGFGNDMLFGRDGADTFLFNTALDAASNVDFIGDFNQADDFIALDDAIFSSLATEAGHYLTGTEFHTGSAAGDADDRIIYDDTTGALFYDSDGTGGAAQVQFATLAAGVAFVNDDFIVV